VSIQSTIDKMTSKDGGGLTSVVLHNEAGDAVIPDNVNVSFYDCNIGVLTCPKNNAIYIGGSELGKSKVKEINQTGGSIVAEKTIFTEKSKFKEGVRFTKVENCYFSGRHEIEDNCSGDFYKCKFTSKDPEFAVSVKEKSNIVFSQCLFYNVTELALKVRKYSNVELVGTTIEKSCKYGINAQENANITVGIGSAIKPWKVGIESYKGCNIAMFGASIDAGSYGLYLGKSLKFSAQQSKIKGNTAVYADKNSILDLFNNEYITGNVYGIQLKENTKCSVTGLGKVTSMGQTAIKLEKNSSISCIDVQKIEGLGEHGIDMQDDCELNLVSNGSAIVRGYGQHGIVAKNNCKININQYNEVKGFGGDGINASENTKCYITNTTNVQGLAGDGIKLSEKCTLSAQDVKQIEGTAGNGISAESSCKLQLQSINQCKGVAGDGIKVSQSSTLDLAFMSLIEGVAGKGINAEESCDVVLKECSTVKGALGAVSVITSGSLVMDKVQTIQGDAPFGIMCQSGVDVRLVDLPLIQKGVLLQDCISYIKNCNIINDDGTGLTVQDGEAKLYKVKAMGSGSASLFVGCKIEATAMDFTQAIISQNSVLYLHNINLAGNLVSSSDSYHIDKLSMTGSMTFTLSAIDIEGGSILGSITGLTGSIDLERVSMIGSLALTGSSTDIESCSLAGTIALAASSADIECTQVAGAAVLTASHMKLKTTVLPSLALSGMSSCDVQGGVVGAIVLDPTSSAIVQSVPVAITGAGNVIALMPGAVTPTMNQVTLDVLGVHIYNMYRASVDLTLTDIIENTITSGGNITLMSTVATKVL